MLCSQINSINSKLFLQADFKIKNSQQLKVVTSLLSINFTHPRALFQTPNFPHLINF